MSPIAQGLFHQWNLWSKGDMDDTRYVKEREREEEREREGEEEGRARRKGEGTQEVCNTYHTHR